LRDASSGRRVARQQSPVSSRRRHASPAALRKSVSPRRENRPVPTSRGSRHSSVASDRQSPSASRRQRNTESVRQNRSTDRRQRTSPVSKQKSSPKAVKRARSRSSSSDEEQQNTSKYDDYREVSKPGASAERQTKAAQHRPSRHEDKQRKTTPETRGNISPDRRQRSSPGRRTGASPDRRRRPSAEKYQRGRNAGQQPARRSPERRQQVHARSRSNSPLSPKRAVRNQDAVRLQRESDRMDRQRASSPANAGARRVRKESSSSPEPVKAIPAAKEQQPTVESQSDKTSGMAAELTKTRRTSRSESGDADVKKRKELSGNEEVNGFYFLFYHCIVCTPVLIYLFHSLSLSLSLFAVFCPMTGFHLH